MDIEKRDGPERPDNNLQRLLLWSLLALGVIALLALGSSDGMLGPGVKNLTYDQFITALENGQVKALSVEKGTWRVLGEFNASGLPAGEPTKFACVTAEEDFVNNIRPLLAKTQVKWSFVQPSRFWEALAYVLPWIILGLLFYFLIFRQMRGAGGGGILSFGKSRAVLVNRDKNRKTFNDVAGIDEAREEVMEIVEFLRTPEKFERLGGRLPRGVLLIGAPGTGKTLLAKAIAGEADRPFFSISGSDFVEMFVGVGASRVRDLFEQAKANSPCIIFLDEIDAVGRRRANDIPGSGVETAQTLNAILVEMDGFTSNDKVIVIAATNRPDVLDPALLRPGRFDRRITVDMPDIRGREEILRVHTQDGKVPLAADVDLSVIARGTPSFSGAELANLVNEAALIAVMKERDQVDRECFEEARDKVRWGKAKHSRKMSEEDRRDTAYHEAGHALLMRLLPHVSPLHKVSIIPRGMALGATMQLPEKDEYSLGKRRVLGQIAVCLGGRAAEELCLRDITTGAANDLEQATNLARAMVCEWGMSDKVGLIHYSERSTMSFVDENAVSLHRDCSEATSQLIDEEIRGIIDNAYRETLALLKEHREDMELLVQGLMEFETLSADEVNLLLTSRALDQLRAQRQAALPAPAAAPAPAVPKAPETAEAAPADAP